MSGVSVKCFKCSKILSFSERVGFRDECDSCHSDARSCKNCKFYDPKAYNECKEPQADVVMEKERSNRCDFFQPNGGAGGGAAPGKTSEDLLSAAEALFRKK